MHDPSLFALVLHLAAASPGALPAHVGQQAQALFLTLVDQIDPQLAATLHADARAKPFTVAVLPDAPRQAGARRAVRAGQTVALRVTLLAPELFAPVTRALLGQGARPTLRLGALPLALAAVDGTPTHSPWAGFSSFASLAEAAQPATRAVLHFVTPTAFSQGDDDGRKRVAVLPEPQLVFASLLRRWNDLAPQPLNEGAVDAAIARVVIAGHELRTTTMEVGKAVQIGFVGRCAYELRGSPAERRLLALLADAAFFLGVGMKTARGMGLCRRLKDEG